MQVNAIQSYTNFTGRFNRNNNDTKTPDENSKVINNRNSNGLLSKAANGAVVAMFMLPVAGGALSSCDSEAFARADSESHAYAKDSCGCHHMNGKDTIRIVIPGKDSLVHDTITQIIEKHDTTYIKKGFDSPVIDALRDFFESNGIPLGDKRIPLSIQWVDEQNVPAYYKQLFDGRSSSYNELSYDAEKTPWSDESGSFVIGGPNDTYENYRYSLTSDGKLMMMRFIARNPYKKPTQRGDWMYSNSAVYDINKNKKIVERYSVNDSDGSQTYAGTFEPGETANTIKVTNPYGTDWRYTNVKVETGDAPDIDD